jgi:hypothetical protein
MRHRFFRILTTFLQNFLSAVVRAVVTTFVFGLCVVVVAHYMGVPLPSARQVLREFEGISKLARVLS